MPKFTDLDSLTAAFMQLGISASEAKERADEQLESGEAFIERESFLRLVNSFVFEKDGVERVHLVGKMAAEEDPDEEDEEFAFGHAAGRLLAVGADPKDIVVIIREMQYDLLQEVFSLLDTVSDYDDYPVDEFNVYAINEDTNEPECLVDALHESIYEMKEW